MRDHSASEAHEQLLSFLESPGEISDARLEDFDKSNAAYEPPSDLAPDLIKVSTTSAVSDTLKAVLLQLSGKSASRTDSPCGEQLC